MVFDLVVESAVPEVRQGVSLDISTGQDLAAHEVELAIAVQGRHPFVVGGEHGARVQAKQGLMDQDKQEGLPDAERVEHQAKIQGDVKHHQRRLDHSMSRFSPQEILHAGGPYANPFQEQDREEVETLVSNEKSQYS